MVLLEAMQQFLPCVTTDEGGISDVVIQGKTGLISKKEDAQDLAKCLEKLLQDSHLRKIMGQEGYEHFKKNFTQQKFEECMLSVLTCVGGGKFVNYLGRKYGEEKEAVFHESDIFVFPSFYSNECFPLVLLEAMQFGIPIITTKEGAIPDLVIEGVNGYLIDSADPVTLANKISTLLQSTNLRRKMGTECRNRIQKYSIKAFEQDVIRALNLI